ncbi:hypothetical protein LA080_003150 [Diaporthe eres]|nr:hypothetical protein LA080_003150 [Diaporthe eres]
MQLATSTLALLVSVFLCVSAAPIEQEITVLEIVSPAGVTRNVRGVGVGAASQHDERNLLPHRQYLSLSLSHTRYHNRNRSLSLSRSRSLSQHQHQHQHRSRSRSQFRCQRQHQNRSQPPRLQNRSQPPALVGTRLL